MQEPKYKPVVFVNGQVAPKRSGGSQVLLEKALDATSDPKKMKQMMGVRTAAEVFRTLDKISMRKEYHRALDRAGISFDFLVQNIKDLGERSESDKVRLAALQILLKSLGMEKYDVADAGGGGDWEETLLKKMNDEKDRALPAGTPAEEIVDYEVSAPPMPDSAKALRDKERKIGESLYG